MSVNNSTIGPCGTPIDLLRQCKDDLRSKKLLAEGKAKASDKTVAGKISSRHTNTCFVLKANETVSFYRNIDFYFAIEASVTTETVQKNVDEFVKKSDALEKAIADAAKAIKAIKDKANEVKSMACELDSQMKDDCNKAQLKILRDGFTNNCKSNFDDYDLPEQTFDGVIAYLIEKSNKAKELADKAFGSVVDISGIQTFSNVDSLKELSKTLAEKGKEFKGDIDKNVKDNTAELAKAQEELAKIIKELSVTVLEGHKASTEFEGTAFTLDFVCSPDSCDDGRIQEICCKVQATLCDAAGCAEEKPALRNFKNER